MKDTIKKDLWKTLKQFVKFGIVGGINTILSYLIINVGYYILCLHAQLSNLIAFIITVFISFLLNSRFVFQQTEGERKSFWKSLFKVYASYSITSLFLTAILLYVEEYILGVPLYIATLLNLIVTVPINFLLNKFWAYNKK